jgi:CBS domain-containing protein
MRLEEIMKHDVETLRPRDTVELAARKMRDENIGFLPVIDGDGKVLGVITDRDLAIRVVAGGRPSSTPVMEVMSRDVVCVDPDEDVERAHELLGQRKVSRLLACDEEGRLVGIISLSDLAQHDERSSAETLRQVSEREATTH